ncbi:MAG: sulfite exporter TauE/SafE family protein [Rhodothermus sp.]|nr:sulfite exporter TauE/SafE family protein [Rhodothermus sp.]
MQPTYLLLLSGIGLLGGFLAGLVGVGGGIVFAPVLFFYFQAIGVPASVVTPLTLGTSLFCTLLASLSSAWFQYRRQAVVATVALGAGLFSALSITLTTRYVTTQPWYNGTAFRLVFGFVLLSVALRMLRGKERNPGVAATFHLRWSVLAGAGTVAGTVAAAAGVGGGIILVPLYHRLLGLPMHRAVGTSSATIVLISLAGILSYALSAPATSPGMPTLGHVDVLHGLLLAVPATISARFGVQTAHRLRTIWLRRAFAVLALFVAGRLLLQALSQIVG